MRDDPYLVALGIALSIVALALACILVVRARRQPKKVLPGIFVFAILVGAAVLVLVPLD